MHRHALHRPLLGLVLAAFLASGLFAAEEMQSALKTVKVGNGLSIVDQSKPILHYRYADVRKKPYIDQLRSPSGVQILRDGSSDHVHHHGLMFAVRVDGVNFWEETTPDVGTEKHRSLKDVRTSLPDNVERAGPTEQLEWMGPKGDKPLLVESREIAAYKAADLGATLIDWRSRLELPPGKASAVLTGTHYNGLGMRFVESMDHVGKYFAADNKPGEVGPHDSRLTAARWVAYTAKADGKPVTVALFDHPTNLRHPSVMFTKNVTPNWYSYLSATLNEWKQPVTIKAGAPLNLRYGIAVWDGEVNAATVEKLYQRWVQISNASP